MNAVVTPAYDGVDALLADARSRLKRLSPQDAAKEVRDGALLVDIRPHWQRIREGEIPASLVIERNHLEWRLDPTSEARVPQAVAGQRWIVICSEGYTSSLAADILNSLGIAATDVVGGFRAWQAVDLPWVGGGAEPDTVVGEDSP
jgi:rhodanese-related sulfurtransferase